ncbi:nucleotide disphospho-sugar-binding domain-containing protein [Actinoplanes sp. NPDC051411]|uniref:nucleotide disphospho-sugar-binding domain-containing protein n=1 Tax=Actinoplanes sp. NPDC051411 TaxID=3155522 RepID=UPI0034235468
MRILFVPFSAPSHYLPMVPLIWACRMAGHEVCVAGDRSVEAAVLASGTPMVTIGRAVDIADEQKRARRLVERPDGSVDELAVIGMMLELYAEITRAAAADVVPFVRDWRPDLVLGDPLAFVAPIAAAQAGAPMVRHLWGPDIMRAFRVAGSGAPVRYWPASLRELYERYACEPRADAGVATVDPCPASLEVTEVPERIPVRYIPYNGSGIVPPSVVARPRRRRVLVTWGTTLIRREGIDKFPVAGVVKAALDHDCEVVAAVAAADRQYIEDFRSEITIVENVPIGMIMPTCDAVVHHGASGTMLTAAHHGVPQVVAPATPDVQAYCVPLVALGAGVSVRATGATQDSIMDAMSAALTGDEIRGAAADLRDEIAAQPDPAEAVARLERLAGRREVS